MRFNRPAESHLFERDSFKKCSANDSQRAEVGEKATTKQPGPKSETGIGEYVDESHLRPVAKTAGAAAEHEVVSFLKRACERPQITGIGRAIAGAKNVGLDRRKNFIR